jgi:hypothetical protein
VLLNKLVHYDIKMHTSGRAGYKQFSTIKREIKVLVQTTSQPG